MEKPQMNIALKDTTKLVCDSCKGEIFAEGLMLREVSRFLTGTEKNGLIPVSVFYCVSCKHVNEQFLPKDN